MMPNIDQYEPGKYAVQGSNGQWIDFGGDRSAAEQAYNNIMGYSNYTPRTPSAWQTPAVAGGIGQLGPYNDALNQEYLRMRLNQVDIPAFGLQQALGLSDLTGYYAPSAAQSDDQMLDYIWSHWPGLSEVASANGHDISTPDKKRAFLRNNWLPSNAQGKTVAQVAQGLGMPPNAIAAASAGQAGAMPTLARQKWDEQNKQFYTNFLGSKSGPRDWALAQALRPGAAFGEMMASPSWEQAAANFAQSGRNAPSAAEQADWWRPSWGQWGTPPQAGIPAAQQGLAGTLHGGADTGTAPLPASGSGGNIDYGGQDQPLELYGANGANATLPTVKATTTQGSWWQPPRNLNTAFGDVRQPTSIRPTDWARQGMAGQEMQRGVWAAQGIDPNDAEQMMRRAWPTGQAAQQTIWR